MSRPTIALLSTANLRHNLATIRSMSPTSQCLAVVKANAYGHGIRSVCQRLQGLVDYFGVASIDEALAIRQVDQTTPIVLMEGVFQASEYTLAQAHRCQVVTHCPEQIAWLNDYPKEQAPLTAWLKIDTGMGRLGFAPSEALDVLETLKQHRSIGPTIPIMTHLACAENINHTLNRKQRNVLDIILAQLPDCSSHPLSLCNSAAILTYPNDHGAIIRPGLNLYGASNTSDSLALKPVMTLKSRLISVKTLPKGHCVGYGGHFICPERMPVGQVAMGYGDGYPRHISRGTPVRIHGILCPIIGQISMDMLSVDLRPCFNARVGDWVTLWGDDLPIETIATASGRSPSDLLCSVMHRVQFDWQDTLPVTTMTDKTP